MSSNCAKMLFLPFWTCWVPVWGLNLIQNNLKLNFLVPSKMVAFLWNTFSGNRLIKKFHQKIHMGSWIFSLISYFWYMILNSIPLHSEACLRQWLPYYYQSQLPAKNNYFKKPCFNFLMTYLYRHHFSFNIFYCENSPYYQPTFHS